MPVKLERDYIDIFFHYNAIFNIFLLSGYVQAVLPIREPDLSHISRPDRNITCLVTQR